MPAKNPPGLKAGFLGFDLARQFAADPLSIGYDLLKLDEPFVYNRVVHIDLYFALSPEAVHQVLVKEAKKFHKTKLQKKTFGKFDGNGLVNSDGDFWKQQRKLMQPAFHSKRIRNYADVMAQFAAAQADGWRDGQEVNIQTEMTRITLNIVAKTLFDADVKAQAERVGEIVHLIQEKVMREFNSLINPPDWLPLPYIQREMNAIRELQDLLTRIIDERRASGEDRGDLLSMLLLSRDEDGNGMSDEQARDEAITLFVAGHETTATALAWTWYLIAAHPEVEAALLRELDDVLGRRAATFEDVPKLRYTEQVFKEAMRLYPPAWLYSRAVVEPVEICGYELPVGAMVNLFPFFTHRDPRLWERPNEFDPDRFAPERAAQIPDYAYYPFGGGPRVCIGNSFAMMEATLVIATILQRCRFTLAAGQGEPEMEPLIALRPKDGIRMIVHARDSEQVHAHGSMATSR